MSSLALLASRLQEETNNSSHAHGAKSQKQDLVHESIDTAIRLGKNHLVDESRSGQTAHHDNKPPHYRKSPMPTCTRMDSLDDQGDQTHNGTHIKTK